MTDSDLAPTPAYGTLDASFLAAGGIAGIEKLVDDFYDQMEVLSEAKKIRAMHPDDLTVSRDKLARFLCAWLGGPRRYVEKYGSINIPEAHQHFNVGESERDAWLLCMEKAIARQPYSQDFATYLLQQLRIPAERVRQVSQKRMKQEGV